ncbi:MAG: alpha/beta hydrolase, partial [Opitutales bacterium]
HYGSLILRTLAIAYLGGIVFAYFFADSLMFPYEREGTSAGPDAFHLKSAHGDSIEVLHLPAENADTLLFYHHGNGEDLSMIRPLLEAFQKRGIAVLAYDYPGYGNSSGEAGVPAVHAAADATYRHATEELNFDPGQIILYGSSLGSGPASRLAARHPVGGLVLHSAFTSAFRVMTRIRLLPWDKFNNLARLPEIECPVLVIHGTEDKTVPFSHARKLWKNIRGEKRKLWIDGAGHNDLIPIAGEKYWDSVLRFIRKFS